VSGAGGVLFLFLDGVGIGPADPARNPFLVAALPTVRGLLDGDVPTLGAPRRAGTSGPRTAATAPLDARLGIDGTPQSGTGQTALLTGRNAARLFGRHFGPWVPVGLRPMVEEESILRRAVEAGVPAAFANAYPAEWPGPKGSRRLAAPPLAARGAGLLTRDHRHLRRGEAIASEIVNEGWRVHLGFEDLPRVSPVEAGRNLGRLAAGHGLTLFAHYATDTAGHTGEMAGAVAALERVDALLAGTLETLPDDHLLVVASDHGNLEDLGRRGHTSHPALGLVAGPDAHERAAGLSDLVGVAPAVTEWIHEAARPGAPSS
jgi:hypothetical protein